MNLVILKSLESLKRNKNLSENLGLKVELNQATLMSLTFCRKRWSCRARCRLRSLRCHWMYRFEMAASPQVDLSS